MDFNLKGRKILVTGSGRGIGQGIAVRLARVGAKVYALDCDQEALDDLVKEIPTITAIHQDLKNWEQTKDVVTKLSDIDGLVNCAGISIKGAAVDITEEQINSIFDVNLKAAINLMQVIGKAMALNGRGGSIVNISSGGGTGAIANLMAYCVAKAGLNMATKVFALELGQHNVRVNSVAPTIVKTKLLVEMQSAEEIKHIESAIPMGRMLDVEDVILSVLFLLSDRSKMIAGTIVTVDGGHACYLPV